MRTRRVRVKRRRNGADAAADYLLLTNGGGCLIPIALALAAVLLGVGVAFAQAEPFDAAYPQAAYMLAEPIHADYQLLAAPSGRWSVQTMGCETIPEYTQVLLLAPLTEPVSAIELGDGTQCLLNPAVRILRQAVPCATRDGVCDVAREPRIGWWEVP